MKTYLVKIFFHKKVRLFFALILFFMIGLHVIYFDHDHQKEIFGNVAQEITHGSDKKLFFVLDVPIFYISFVVVPAGFFVAYLSIFFIFLFKRIFDLFREALRRGIIHPKIYA